MLIPFSYNNNETDPAKRFPDLAGGAYSFNFTVNGQSYTARVTYNIWTNNAVVSVLDPSQVPVIVGTPLIPTFDGVHPDFLWDKKLFPDSSLVYDPDQGGFVFL